MIAMAVLSKAHNDGRPACQLLQTMEASMKRHTLMASLMICLMAGVAAPSASADCDITDTKCYQNGGKCNIKFRNVTSHTNGSGANTALRQQSSAQIIRVKAVKDNGKAAGNILNIEADTSKTMNLDKKFKKDFAWIRVSSPTMSSVDGVTLSCSEVKIVLNGNGTCKIFNGARHQGGLNYDYQLGYRCDGGTVKGPK